MSFARYAKKNPLFKDCIFTNMSQGNEDIWELVTLTTDHRANLLTDELFKQILEEVLS